MFLICRRNSGTLSIACQGPCEDFVKTYIKYNVPERDKENYVLLKAEELNIADYITEPEQKDPTGKKKTVAADTELKK